jgi:DNA polymerase III subunit alpha
MRSFGPILATVATLLGNLESLLEFNKEVSRARDNKQISLFGGSSNILPPRIKLNQVPTVERQERLTWEKDLLGLYITEHPFNDFRRYLGEYVIPLSRLREHMNDEAIRVAGVITTLKKIITKSNKPMLFVKLEDGVAVTELLVFPSVLEKSPELWVEGKVIICQGKLSDKDQDVKVLVDKATELVLADVNGSIDAFKRIEVKARKTFYRKDGGNDSSRSRPSVPPPSIPSAPPLKIIINKELSEEESDKIREILLREAGESKVYFKISLAGQPKIIETGFRVNNSPNLKEGLRNGLRDAITVLED